MRSHHIHRILGVLVVLGTLCCSLLAAEMALRLLDYPEHLSSGWRWDESPYKAIRNIGDHRVNQLGLRGRPFDYQSQDFVILLVGDSYVEAGAQPFEDMPEQILEAAFEKKNVNTRVRVFSVASAGWAQDQELLWLTRYFEKYRANLVVNFLTPVNDFWENSFIDRSVTQDPGRLKPTYRLLPGNQLSLVLDPGSKSKVVELLRRASAKLKYGAKFPAENYYMHRWMTALPEARLRPVSSSECPTRQVLEENMIDAYRAGERQMTALTNEDVLENRTHFSPFIIPRSPREDYQIDITRRLLLQMQQTAIGHGAQFRAFYPRGSDIDLAVKYVACIKHQPTSQFYRTDMQDLLQFVATSDVGKNLIVADIKSAAPTTLSSQDWHLNRFGNELAMGQLADALIGPGLIE